MKVMAGLLMVCVVGMVHPGTPDKSVKSLIGRTDRSCGPRCLLTLTRLTRSDSQSPCSLESIYDFIGKEPNTPTSLYDLKIAARRLGFRAEGYKCTMHDLARMNGYAILPVGASAGTVAGPFHFVLVAGVRDGTVLIVDPHTGQVRHAPASDLAGSWNGYALVVSPTEDGPLFSKRSGKREPPSTTVEERSDYVRDFGLVDSGSVLQHRFPIRNETGAAINLRIASKSCSCLSAELGQTKLGPGRETFLGLRLHVNRPGVSVGRVAVEQRPPGLIKRYAVTAYGKDSFFTIPAIGYIEAPAVGVIEYPVRIVYYADTNDTVLFDRMDGSNGQLQLANVVAKGQGGQEYTTFIFDVTLRLTAEKPAGTAYRFGEHISFVLATSRGMRSIPFEISGTIGRPAFRLTPESLFIVTARPPEPFRRNVKVEFLTQPPPTHITVEPSEGLNVAIGTKAISAGTFLVSISAAEQRLRRLSPGMNEGQLTITPGQTPDAGAITVPVSVFLRE